MANEIRFDGRVAIVTGAGAGLGRTYALELARRGAKVVVNDYGGARDGSGTGSASPADAVVKDIKDKGGQAVANYDNVATVEGGEGIVKTAVAAFGTVDILVNNAGILRDKGMLKMEPENWNAVIAVHLKGAYDVTKPAFTVMREKGYGRIVMTSSSSGIYGNFGQTNYGAAKVALVGFMNTLKLEGGKYNIKVNTVAPSAASRLTEDVLPPDLFTQLKPEFVMPLVVYLCSEECPVSGNIYHAMSNSYNRIALMTSPGIAVTDGKKVPTVEEVVAKWDKVANMAGAKEYPALNDLTMTMLGAIQANA
jgi:NAD(P)-dependent dehydrogenase (short-subunit alcohol dehydrogenase family)